MRWEEQVLLWGLEYQVLPWGPKGKNKKGCCMLRTEPWFSPRAGYIGVWLGMGAGRNRALEVTVHCLDSAFQDPCWRCWVAVMI